MNSHEVRRSLGRKRGRARYELSRPAAPAQKPASLAQSAQIKNAEKLIKIKELRIRFPQELIEIETFDKDCIDPAQLEYLMKQKAQAELMAIKGLLATTSTEEIKTDLLDQEVLVMKVPQITQRKSKCPLPLFLVEIRKHVEGTKDIYDLSKGCYMSNLLETFQKTPGPTQS
ncbi:hypothetical protein TNCT_595271 [Trichonephila clavata]|uniref:Pre-C2HC domain-containing protein n=1 Tax=Trichonephila clavata TaxID=2740835 RepID=A0A8X6JNI3_TRICU|nr:hypothetical protein TNCT_595271 [Trichonephila clavata]